MNKKIVIFSTILVLGILAIIGYIKQGSDNKSEEVVKIGTIGPLSGDAAAYGEQVVRVLEYNLPKINEKAKANNIKFEFIHEDAKCTGSDAVAAYQKLKDIDGVKFIIGGVCSSETLALAPLTKTDRILTISPGSSNPNIEGASPYTYTFSYSDDVIGKTLAKEMSKYKRVAIVTEQNDYNIGIRDVWMEAMKQYNTEIVANEVFPKGGGDFRVVLEKIKKTQPDAILLNPNAGVTAQSLIKQLGEIQDWDGYQLYSQVAYNNKSALAVAPSVTEGMIIVDAPKMTDADLLRIKESIETEKGTLDDLGSYYTASTLDVSNILTDLIVEFGDNPEAVRNALASRTFNAYIGSVHFGDSNFPGTEGGIYIVKNGVAEYQD